MPSSWPTSTPGLLRLPSGRVVRGRSLRTAAIPPPDLGVYLTARPVEPVGWEVRWVRWRDFWLPDEQLQLTAALREGLRRAVDERVEVACTGGRGRTGTALACLAVLDGVPADRAVSWVRVHWSPRAVETPWQARFVRRFPGRGDASATP